MNDFLTFIARWTIRLVLLSAGILFFLSLLCAAFVLAAIWGIRALWCKLTGQPVSPWVMPLGAAGSWRSMYQRAGGFARSQEHQAASAKEQTASSFTPPAGSKRSGVLSKVAGDVSDVQSRELRE